MFTAASPAQADASSGISGTCGLHIGKLLRRDSGGSVYQMRIGPREYHSGGDMVCKGLVLRGGTSQASTGTHWDPWALPSWNYFFAGRVTFESALTAQSCKAFGGALLAAVASEGALTPGAVLTGGGCAYGVYTLGQLLPGTDNMTGMRLVK